MFLPIAQSRRVVEGVKTPRRRTDRRQYCSRLGSKPCAAIHGSDSFALVGPLWLYARAVAPRVLEDLLVPGRCHPNVASVRHFEHATTELVGGAPR